MIKSANRIALEAMRAEMEKQAIFGDIWNGIKGGASAVWDATKDAVGGAIDTVKNVGRGAYNGVTAGLKTIGGIGGSIGSGLAQMVGATETADAMRGWANDQFKGVGEDLGDMWDSGKGALGGVGRSLWGSARLAVPGITAGAGAINGVISGAEQRGAQQAQQAQQPQQPQQPAQPQGIADHVNKQIANDKAAKPAGPMSKILAPIVNVAQQGAAMANTGSPNSTSTANPQPNPANARAAAQAGNAMMNGGRPSRSSMANPQPNPTNARAAAQAGNSMMNGGRASRSSMAANPAPAAAPVAAPQATPQAAPRSAVQATPQQAAPAGYNPSAITRDQMRQYSRYTGARNMNSDMDRWKTYQAMNGNRNASNRDYYAARRNGFR